MHIYNLIEQSSVFEVLYYFVNIFSSGRSQIKVILFIVFCAVSFALFLARGKVRIKFSFLKTLAVVVSLTYLLGIGLHIYSLSRLNIPVGKSVIYFSQEEMSSSWIFHTHELKSSFGQFFKSFSDQFDVGVASLNFVPPIVRDLGVTGVTLILLFYFLAILNGEFKDKKWFIINIFISFILFKNVFDGGRLNYEVMAVLLFWLTYYLYKKGIGGYSALLALPILGLAIFYYYFAHLLIVYIFLLILCLLVFGSKKYKILSLLLIIFITLMHAYAPHEYRQMYLEKGYDGYFIKLNDNNSNNGDNSSNRAMENAKDGSAQKLYSIGRYDVYHEAGNQMVKDIADEYDLVTNHKPISVEWKMCLPHSYKIYKFSFKDLNNSTNEQGQGGSQEKMKDQYQLDKGVWYSMKINKVDEVYRGELRLDACASLSVDNQVQEGLSELGLLPRVIYDFVLDISGRENVESVSEGGLN